MDGPADGCVGRRRDTFGGAIVAGTVGVVGLVVGDLGGRHLVHDCLLVEGVRQQGELLLAQILPTSPDRTLTDVFDLLALSERRTAKDPSYRRVDPLFNRFFQASIENISYLTKTAGPFGRHVIQWWFTWID